MFSNILGLSCLNQETQNSIVAFDIVKFFLSLNHSIVVATTYHKDKWSHKQINLKSRYNVGSSQENLTRSLFSISVLFIQKLMVRAINN